MERVDWLICALLLFAVAIGMALGVGCSPDLVFVLFWCVVAGAALCFIRAVR